MEIQNITVEDLRRMEEKEGLDFAGLRQVNPGEWVQGINALFAQDGILLEGTTYPCERIPK